MRNELLLVRGPGDEVTFLEYGFHNYPDRLREEIQREVNISNGFDYVILGYGLCGKGTLGIRAQNCPIVIPRIEDCIPLFLGSPGAYQKERRKEPGTYYLTKGWIEYGSDPLKDYQKWVERYGERKARILVNVTYKYYTRIGLINTGSYDIFGYWDYVQKLSAFLKTKSEVIPGSMCLFEALAKSEWDKGFILINPGAEIERMMFQ